MEIGLLILGIVAGILSGLFGIGGGIVMVPMLIAVFGMTILDANSTSLAAMLLPVGILGVITYYKAGYINLRDSLWVSLGLLAGSYFGSELAVNMEGSLLAKLYACFLIYIAFDYLNLPALFRKIRGYFYTSLRGRSPKQSITPTPPLKRAGNSPFKGMGGSLLRLTARNDECVFHPAWQFIAVGLFAGVIAGLFGKGGGIVIVPALIKLFKYEPKKAAATSLAALQLPVGLPAVIVYAESGHLQLLHAAMIAAGIVAGALLGTKIAIKMPSALFKRVYAVFLVTMAFYMVFKYV